MIELSYLKDIAEGDRETENQLIELFIIQVEEIRQRFEKAFKDNNIDEIAKIAHLAKSTTKVMGITTVSENMQKLQHLAEKSESTSLYPTLVQSFYDNIPIAVKELQEYMKQQ